ncbi:hypothetical protein K8I28_03775 [bacterium]|nr:hypothetical protein [bacterium]
MEKPASSVRKGRFWSQLAIEVISIFVSILLAFSVNQWRENHAKKTLAEKALTNCTQEIEANLEQVEQVHVQHEKIFKLFQEEFEKDHANESALDVFGRLFLSEGLNMALVTHSSWDATVASGAVQYMLYETTSALSELYSVQINGLEKTTERLNSFFFTINTVDPAKTNQQVKVMAMLFQELSSQENFLAEMYKDFLAGKD